MSTSNNDLSGYALNVRKSSVGYLLKQASQRMDKAMAAALRPMGVSMEQFKIVMALTESEGITQSEIGARTGLASYSVTRLLDALAAEKLVVRRPNHESRRSFSIYLTAKGKALSPKLFEAVSEVNRTVLASLSGNEMEELQRTLSKIAFD